MLIKLGFVHMVFFFNLNGNALLILSTGFIRIVCMFKNRDFGLYTDSIHINSVFNNDFIIFYTIINGVAFVERLQHLLNRLNIEGGVEQLLVQIFVPVLYGNIVFSLQGLSNLSERRVAENESALYPGGVYLGINFFDGNVVPRFSPFGLKARF